MTTETLRMGQLWPWVSKYLKKQLKPSLLIVVPYGWLLLFFLIPFVMVLKISFAELIIGLPPYTPLISWVEGHILHLKITLDNYLFVMMDTLYLHAYFNSLWVAFLATLSCLVLGYPMAYGMTRAPDRFKTLLLMLIILPFWTSFLVRVYAWVSLLSPQGILNTTLIHLGLIQHPLPLMNNTFSVWIGIVYSYLPFMILPLYASLEKIDPSLVEAAFDLGAKPFKVFWKIIVPLSLPGAISGAILVFIPAVGEFVIPELLGGSRTLMIGRVLWNEFFHNRDWPVACALAILMLILLLIPMMIFQRLQNKEAQAQGAQQ